MRYIAVRGSALSTESKNAWKQAGVTFAHPDRDSSWLQNFAEQINGAILNLGRSQLNTENTPIWNLPETVFQMVWPGRTRQLLNDLMPPRPETFPAEVWIKAPGSKGRGKYRKEVRRSLVLPSDWDWQLHVEGQEYRLITVGYRLVQQHLRYGDNKNRRYEWLRMRDVPVRLKTTVREAAQRLAGRNIIAWDTIWSNDNPYILEGNTCPGVNNETVERIIKEMARVEEEDIISWLE